MEELQLCRSMVIMSYYSAFHGLNLAAIHAQGKWKYHFQHILELREGDETFSWQNLVTQGPGMTHRGMSTSWQEMAHE